MKNFIPLFALAFAVGCGIPDDRPLNEIDADLWAKVCDRATEASDAIECDGFTIEAQSKEEAEAACNDAFGMSSEWTDCTATFGDWVTWRDWDPTDPCDLEEEPPAEVTAAAGRVLECMTPAM